MYIGPKQIESTQILEGKTFNGNNIYKVIYAGGDSEIISETALNLMQTEEPSDFTAARTKQFNAIRKQLFPLIGAYVSSLALDTEEDKKAASKDFLEKSLILLAEYSIKQRDIDVLFDGMAGEITVGTFKPIGNLVDEHYNRVTNFLWTGDDKKYIPGYHPISDITYLETKGFLEKINPDEKSN